MSAGRSTNEKENLLKLSKESKLCGKMPVKPRWNSRISNNNKRLKRSGENNIIRSTVF